MKTDTTKPSPPKSIIYEYDMTAEQTIPFSLEKNGKPYRVSHKISPLGDLRYIALEDRKEEVKKNTVRSQTAVLKPSTDLWDDLIIERIGYAAVDDIRKKTYIMDKVKCILGLLYTKIKLNSIPEEPSDVLEADILFSDDEANEVILEVLQNGVLITTNHFFSEETQDQMDEYLSILTGSPVPNKLASMGHKKSKAERLVDLYDEVHLRHFGYKDGTEVPAWHKVPAVMDFFARQFSRMD